MMLRGYRRGDEHLLTGPWLPGELLGLPPADRPVLAEPARVPAPVDESTEVCIVDGLAFVRFSELDWVHRRARLEIGLRADAADPLELAGRLVKVAVQHGLQTLGLHRVHGWLTPAANPPAHLLAAVGFECEATVPAAGWLAGRPVDRQVWGVLGR